MSIARETMRGKSELKQEGPAAKQTSSGLDRNYITNRVMELRNAYFAGSEFKGRGIGSFIQE